MVQQMTSPMPNVQRPLSSGIQQKPVQPIVQKQPTSASLQPVVQPNPVVSSSEPKKGTRWWIWAMVIIASLAVGIIIGYLVL